MQIRAIILSILMGFTLEMAIPGSAYAEGNVLPLAIPDTRSSVATPASPTPSARPSLKPLPESAATPSPLPPPLAETLSSEAISKDNSLPSGISSKPKRNPSVQASVKLKPKIRTHNAQEKNTISLDNIRPFLRHAFVFENAKQFSRMPHVVAVDQGRLGAGVGNLIQVRGLTTKDESFYTLYRKGKAYRHPITKEYLGYEAIAIGTAELERFCGKCDEIAQLKILTSEENIEVGARLLPSYASALPPRLMLRNAKWVPEGYILEVIDGLTDIGRNFVVTLSLGCRDGLKEGHYLDIYQTGKSILDPLDTRWRPCKIKLCDTRIGRLLVYKTFEKISLALVIEATQPIHLLDMVKNP